MNKSTLISVDEVKKRRQKIKKSMTIPTIQRTDIMTGLLSSDLNHAEHARLSNLYAEITYMEKTDLKYIREIAVSSQSDLEIYEMLEKLNQLKLDKPNQLKEG